MNPLKPKRLTPGSTIGIVACSLPITASSEATIDRAYQQLKAKGFRLIEAPNCCTVYGHAAGTIKARVKALHDFFRNSKIDGILNYWGGYQSHQLLEYLDFDLIRKNPKPFIGFSDTTALQIGLYVKSGLVTFSGPAGITFGKPVVPEFTWKHFENALMKGDAPWSFGVSETFSDNPWYMESGKKMRFEQNPGWTVFRNGKAEGTILGGNLGTMLLLAGTKYWPDFRKTILFVEEDEAENSKTIDRMFTQLRQMGVFDRIAGLIVGRFHCNVKFHDSDSLEMILEDALKGYDFPVITGFDFGHTDPLITFPLGVRCRVDTHKLEVTVLESAVI